MSIEYRLAKDPQDPDVRPSWTKPHARVAATDQAVKRLAPHQGQGFRMKIRGETDFGQVRPLDELKPRLRRALEHDQVGEIRTIMSVKDSYRLLIRPVQVVPKMIETSGNDNIDKIHTALVNEFDGWESWGICNCRPIAGSSVWSQHSWCNAEDIHGSSTKLDQMYRFLIEKRERGELPVGTVLWRVADHYDHIHFEGRNKYSGYPPCA